MMNDYDLLADYAKELEVSETYLTVKVLIASHRAFKQELARSQTAYAKLMHESNKNYEEQKKQFAVSEYSDMKLSEFVKLFKYD